jgi:hypothetical protein
MKASNKYRSQRDVIFRSLFGPQLEKGCKILDIGGEPAYWEQSVDGAADYYSKCHITMVNIRPQTPRLPNMTFVVGDATNLSQFADKSFDIVISNSVIEHVGSYENQKKMASEVRRLAKTYFLQTPNYYFIIEPHSYCPFFNRLPFPLRLLAARFWPFGHMDIPDFSEKSKNYIRNSVNLLKFSQMKELFPDGTIIREKALGGTKSFVVHNAS